MAARRAVQAKSLASNSNLLSAQVHNKSRLKSTSMTNLVSSSSSSLSPSGQTSIKATASGLNTANRMQRPASRNALDNIHKGMNAKFTHVQSKVLLQNIRPQQAGAAGAGAGAAQSSASSRIPSTTPTSSTLRHKTHFASNNAISTTTTTSGRLTTTRGATLSPAFGSASASASNTNNRIQQSDKSQLINKIKALQERLERQEAVRDELKQELEREKADKSEQVQQVKLELQEKVLENERHSEEYHQKLLEAYELADQNRRAADSVLSESRQREDELRKKIDELEQQLGELREFVAMKEEMVGKMGELREQIKIERERYEDKTRQLGQMFDNEKISSNSKSAPMCADQNSNYFSRAKPSLQSVESINRLDGQSMTFSMEQQQQQQQQQDQYGGALSKKKKQQAHNKSEHDIYGSKLSTRMQDGARSAWKKSRKFASSVITGGLGGLQACRRNGTASTPPSKRPHDHHMDTSSGLSINHNRLQDGHAGSGALNCATASSEANLNAKLSSSYTSLSGHSQNSQQRHHYHSATQAFPVAVTRQPQLDHTDQQEAMRTSVIEVGVTVGEYIQQQQQHQQAVSSEELSPARVSLPSPALHVVANCSEQTVDDQQRMLKDNGSVTSSNNNNNDSNSLIRVDANNKLTIVTKFNDSSQADCCHSARLLASNSSNLASTNLANNPQHQQQPSSSSSGSTGSERSRCESSSSGRGTSASDSGSSASQNGDHLDQQEHQDVAKKTGQLQAQAVEVAQAQQQENFQGHKRKSSLFKASNVFGSSGGSNGSKSSQVSLNKTIKSLFSLASSSMLSANKSACKYSNCSIVNANSTTTTTTADSGHDQQAVSRSRRQSSGGEPVVATSIVRNHHSFDESAPQPFHTITLSSSAATDQFQKQHQQQSAPPAMGSFKGAPMASSFSSKCSRRSVAVYDADDNDNDNNNASETTNKVGGNDDKEAATATAAAVSVGVGELERAIMHKFAQDDSRITNFGQGATTVLVRRSLNSRAQTDSPKLNENNNDNDNTKCCRSQLSAIEAGH